MSDVTRAGDFWDREIVQPTHTSWMAELPVRLYINHRISGAGEWPIDWFDSMWLNGRKFGRALSIGCGSGALERDLVRRGLCSRVDAFDGSLGSLLVARRAAAAEGVGDRIRYFASDFNAPALPRNVYDAVFFHQSLHHVGKLEKLLRAVLLALKPDGLLYLDEYVGPSRTDWTDDLVAPQRAVYDALPSGLRSVSRLPLPIQPDDPSEAIRSGEIMEQLRLGFDVLEHRGYGGNLLSVLYPSIEWSRAPAGTLETLIETERAMLAKGEPSFYAIVVAKPKRGLAKLFASWRYWTEPKAKRVLYEIRSRLG